MVHNNKATKMKKWQSLLYLTICRNGILLFSSSLKFQYKSLHLYVICFYGNKPICALAMHISNHYLCFYTISVVISGSLCLIMSNYLAGGNAPQFRIFSKPCHVLYKTFVCESKSGIVVVISAIISNEWTWFLKTKMNSTI